MLPSILWIKGAAALAVVVVLAGAYTKWHHHVIEEGKAIVQAEWDTDKAARAKAESVAIAKRTEENTALAAAQVETNRLISRSTENELAKIRTAVADAPRVRVGPAVCGQPTISTEAASARSSHAGDTGTRVVSDAIDADLRELMIQVEQGFAAGRACQAFVKQNGLAE